MTDTELLNVLQELNDNAEYTGKCILRISMTGRGWRLHETGEEEFVSPQISVRQAIEDWEKLQDIAQKFKDSSND